MKLNDPFATTSRQDYGITDHATIVEYNSGIRQRQIGFFSIYKTTLSLKTYGEIKPANYL